MIFPSDNLPTSSKPWAREVTKQLSNVIDMTVTNDINNAARDNQLNSSIIAASAAATAAASAAADAQTAATNAQEAIDGLIGLGSSGSLYDINANNITAGSLTGLTVRTDSAGQRVEMSGASNSIYFYDVNGSQVGYMNGGGVGREGEFIITGPATNYNISFGSTNALFSGAGKSIELNSQGVIVSGSIYASGSYFASGVTQAIIGPGGGVYPTNGTQSTGANVVQDASSAILRRFAASSRRYKNSESSIWESEELDPKKLLNVPVKMFKYNEDYLSDDDQNFGKFLPGLMAEDVNEHYPVAAYNNSDGQVENWVDRSVLVATLALVQDLYKRIEILEGK